ncbi:sulfur oxidation c-type cytochrome SoxA [Pseudorhodobacter sp. E13]|uniref:sulfur oxidation c-type cytochrome SoxA n=1 Tax=Pseudorhodobacter sp. E13 TaxID=2487931 RepID=UPI000F8E83AC|nr:sulfur oxidation c-type cytochrome SoxA [Pseudorhodobacter sp. E13]RUS59642.1 sulfur oxidation c-type cytochrome SoxA [Pseudorhodobacter sp. E13]
MTQRTIKTALAATAILGFAFTGAAMAEPVDDALVIDGTEITIRAPAPAHLDGALTELISGWAFRDTETRAMQMDDFDNPGMIFVDRGLDAWNAVQGTEGKSCASCHEGPESMKGLRAVTPRVDEKTGKVMNIEAYVNDCRTTRMGAEALNLRGSEMTDMLALISFQSRGELVNVAIDGAAAPFYEKGKEIYYTRYGQLELSCASCHEDNYGNYIRSDHLSQGHINGFPVYRLKDAGLVSPQSRFVGCVRDTRAETFAAGSDEFNALELYVAARGNGLAVEGVSVRH